MRENVNYNILMHENVNLGLVLLGEGGDRFTAQLEVLDIDEEKLSKLYFVYVKAKHLHSFLSIWHLTTMQLLQN